MITYILEGLTIQVVFLLIYDLFLEKETFLQWNRVYLLTTFILSLLLPLVKIEAFQTDIPENLMQYQQLLWRLDEVVLTASTSGNLFWEGIYWIYIALGFGSLAMTIWLLLKLNHIRKLKRNGVVSKESDFIKVVIPESEQAFSFFKNIFLGDSIPEEKCKNIVVHEKVHVKQRHSWDLMLFEVMRIIFWFNPIVYVFQNRISEVHEFIADAEASKTNKKEQYELLLSEVFQSQNFSLVNQFFKKSLIKKRIVMLTKKKSKAAYQLKYALLIPLVLGMLIYTSCENEIKGDKETTGVAPLEETVIVGYSSNNGKEIVNFNVKDLDNLTDGEKKKQKELLNELAKSKTSGKLKMVDEMNSSIEIILENGAIASMTVNNHNGSVLNLEEEKTISFMTVDEAPIFPGCEDTVDRRKCFQEKMQEHIRKNFRYPEEAQEKGIQGRVNVLFKIGKDGEITNFRMRGTNKLLEDEAKRIIGKLPKMQPGKQKGEVVEVPFSIPITFKLT